MLKRAIQELKKELKSGLEGLKIIFNYFKNLKTAILLETPSNNYDKDFHKLQKIN